MSLTNAIVTIDKDHAYTTSLLVAEKFNKNHRDVLRAIRKLDVFTEFNELNSEPVATFRERNFALTFREVPGPKNSVRKEPMYILTRQGFTMTAMSFTGREAALWKIAFINAFDRMEAKLNELMVTEHHGMMADLYARHPQWQLTRAYAEEGLTAREIAEKQGKHPANVRRMINRMRQAGLYCPLAGRKQAA